MLPLIAIFTSRAIVDILQIGVIINHCFSSQDRRCTIGKQQNK